jgi:hypothetical protein
MFAAKFTGYEAGEHKNFDFFCLLYQEDGGIWLVWMPSQFLSWGPFL